VVVRVIPVSGFSKGSELIRNLDFSYRGTFVSAFVILDFFPTSDLAISVIPYSKQIAQREVFGQTNKQHGSAYCMPVQEDRT
jgi:hypothetical protein